MRIQHVTHKYQVPSTKLAADAEAARAEGLMVYENGSSEGGCAV
jgi:hypothetical protein